MPQMSFWAESHDVEVSYTFRLDPLNPGGAPQMTVRVKNQAGKMVKNTLVSLPPVIAEEAFADLVLCHLNDWMAWDAVVAHTHLRRNAMQWRRAAEDMAQTR